MKLKAALVAGAVVVLGVPTLASAAPATWKVTGGGQTFAGMGDGSDPAPQGPGDTVAFTARALTDALQGPADGRVTIQDRSDDGTKETFHGIVDCLRVEGNADGGGYAEIGGTERDTHVRFNVRVMDNGQGAADMADLVAFDTATQDSDCSDDDGDNDFETYLARGNAKVHKQSPNQSNKSKSKQAKADWAKALTLAGLRR